MTLSHNSFRIRAIIIDLDGTLVDTAGEISVALDRAFDDLGLAHLGKKQVEALIGRGVRSLVERALVRIRSVGMEPYLDLGSETRSGTRLNREYATAISIEMRILGSRPASTAARLFGRNLSLERPDGSWH